MVHATLEWDKVLEDVGPRIAHRLEAGRHRVPGFGILAVPETGFSQSDIVHNRVIDFCRRHGIRLFNPSVLIGRQERAMTWRRT